MVDAFARKGLGTLAPTPFNRFAHAEGLASPASRFVSADNDILCSIAQLDLSDGPLVLQLPDTEGAYYVVQFTDAWSNNFAYLGRRATGTREGSWLIVPPGWAGATPGSVRGVIEAPTTIVSAVGRIACDGGDDVERVRALQARFTLTSLTSPGPGRAGLPTADPEVPQELGFFEQLRVWMADFPPSLPDQSYQERFQPLGLLEEGVSPYQDASPELAKALAEGLAAGRERVEAAAGTGARGGRPPGAWEMDPHLFDYNLDHFGIGTVDAPEWRLADREASYLTRAVAARTALWGTHGYEAVRAHTFHDTDGERLTGERSYTLRFDVPPPVGAFWSLTMYDIPDYYLVENPAGRYAIGDRTPGLVYGSDGSLTLRLQRERPEDPAHAANWLPTPTGFFRPMMRLYTPDSSVLDGGYVLPGIRAADGRTPPPGSP
ncbi:DUF1254 domain-containing protein [Streptomyces tsukubensis]|nr:DUF1254 domain-containing protein [Streptomyces tsukubensis]